MSELKTYKCKDCKEILRTTPSKGCHNCGSSNLSILTAAEEALHKKEQQKMRFIKNMLIFLGILAFSFLTEILSITTEGCTLPIDIVIFNHTCLFGSFGASLGLTVASAVLIGILSLLGKMIIFFVKKPTYSDNQDSQLNSNNPEE